MKLEERLGANKYYVDETCPHIIIDGESVSREEAMKLVNGCPEVYTHCKRTARLLLILQVVSNVAHVAYYVDTVLLRLGNILVTPRA